MTDLGNKLRMPLVRSPKKRNTVNPNMLKKDVMTLELEDALLSMSSIDISRPTNDIRFAVKSFLQSSFDRYNSKT